MAKLTTKGRKWVNTELKGNDVIRFRNYCKDEHLNFETSDAGYGYTHFEVLCDEDEFKNANEFLMGL